MKPRPTRLGRRGSAYLLAIILLGLFVSVGAAFVAFTNTNVQVINNMTDIHRARLAAESGFGYALRQIRKLALPHTTDKDNAITNIAEKLGECLNGSPNLGGELVTCNGATVLVPTIQMQDGAFDMWVVQQADQTLTLKVQGVTEGVRRVLAVDLILRPGHPNSVFNYGLASRGPISIDGNGEIRGMNEFTEASVISAAEDGVAVTVDGSAIVDGDISSVGTQTSVVISGTPTIAGSQDPEVIAEHIHFGVDPPAFPEVDTSIFRPLATNVINSETDTSVNGQVFNNVVIEAGTNPTFASNVVLNGVVFIEAPNVVTFSGKVTLKGLIATEQADFPIEACKLSFAGQVEALGVEALPDTPEFEAVKAMTGTFIVAPGFDVSFGGQFSTISGTIAAEKLSFSGQAEGTVAGSVIGLGDYPTSVSGHVDIVIDRSGEDAGDAGFYEPLSLEVDRRTYREETPSEGA